MKLDNKQYLEEIKKLQLQIVELNKEKDLVYNLVSQQRIGINELETKKQQLQATITKLSQELNILQDNYDKNVLIIQEGIYKKEQILKEFDEKIKFKEQELKCLENKSLLDYDNINQELENKLVNKRKELGIIEDKIKKYEKKIKDFETKKEEEIMVIEKEKKKIEEEKGNLKKNLGQLAIKEKRLKLKK